MASTRPSIYIGARVKPATAGDRRNDSINRNDSLGRYKLIQLLLTGSAGTVHPCCSYQSSPDPRKGS